MFNLPYANNVAPYDHRLHMGRDQAFQLSSKCQLCSACGLMKLCDGVGWTTEAAHGCTVTGTDRLGTPEPGRDHMTKLNLFAGGALVGALALTGCSPDTGQVPLTATRSMSTVVEPIWSVDVPTVGYGAPEVDGVVLAYTKDGDADLELGAYDGDTGKLLWSTVASTGSTSETSTLRVSAYHGADGRALVTHIAPPTHEGNQWTHVLSYLDVHTGETVFSTPKMWLGTVSDCDTVEAVCFYADIAGEDKQVLHKLDPETGETVRFDDTIPGYTTTRAFTKEAFVVEDSNGAESIVRYHDGDIVWQVPADDVFGAGSDLTRALFGAYYDDKEDVFFANVRPGTPDEMFEYGSADQKVVGLDGKTGEVLWTKDEGIVCKSSAPIICTGDVSFVRAAAGDPITVRSGTITATKFDVTTGKDVWSKSFDNFGGLANGSQSVGAGSFEGGWPFYDGDDLVVMDTTTGEVLTPDSLSVLACRAATTFEGPKWSRPDNETVTFTSGMGFNPCDDSTEPPFQATRSFVEGAEINWTMFDNHSDNNVERIRPVQTGTQLIAYKF